MINSPLNLSVWGSVCTTLKLRRKHEDTINNVGKLSKLFIGLKCHLFVQRKPQAVRRYTVTITSGHTNKVLLRVPLSEPEGKSRVVPAAQRGGGGERLKQQKIV